MQSAKHPPVDPALPSSLPDLPHSEPAPQAVPTSLPDPPSQPEPAPDSARQHDKTLEKFHRVRMARAEPSLASTPQPPVKPQVPVVTAGTPPMQEPDTPEGNKPMGVLLSATPPGTASTPKPAAPVAIKPTGILLPIASPKDAPAGNGVPVEQAPHIANWKASVSGPGAFPTASVHRSNIPYVVKKVATQPPPGLRPAMSSAVQIFQNKAASVMAALASPSTKPASSETGDPSFPESRPPSLSSNTPSGGGASLLLAGGVQVSAGGGVVLPILLFSLCALASGFILLRRADTLSWAFWELPRPSSALLMPLERPG